MTKLIDLERNVRKMDLLKSLSFANIFDFSFCSYSSIEAYAKYASESLEFKLNLFRINAYKWGARTEKSLGAPAASVTPLVTMRQKAFI